MNNFVKLIGHLFINNSYVSFYDVTSKFDELYWFTYEENVFLLCPARNCTAFNSS